MVKYEKIKQNELTEGRALTNIDFIMGFIAAIVLIVIGLRHFDAWGKTNIMEGFFAIGGIFGLQFIKSREINIFKFKKFSFYILPRFLIILIGVTLVQVLSRIPYTIDNVELAASIVFAAVAEELFFRGVLISIFIEVDESIRPPVSSKMLNILLVGETNLNIRIFGLVGVILSSLFFAAIHTNYYDNPAMLMSVFFGGLVFGFAYYLWEDMTANIMAHFLLNMIAVGQSGLLINLAFIDSNVLVLIIYFISLIIFIIIFVILYILRKRENKEEDLE